MEVDFIPPKLEEVYNYFLTKLQDEGVAISLTNKFYFYYERNNWQIKIGPKKSRPMKNWKLAVNTWIKSIPKYNKVESVKLVTKRLSGC